MADKQKTLWPIGILLIIALGVVLISVSIYISSIQSIDTDHTFDMKRTDLNEEINAIMKKQNVFESIYNVHISTIGDTSSSAPTMRNPYYVGGVPRDIPTDEGALHKGSKLSIFVEPRVGAVVSGKPNAIVIPEMSITRLDQGEKKANEQKITAELENIGKHNEDSPLCATFLADMPPLQKPGFYQVRLHTQVIEYNTDSHNEAVPTESKVSESGELSESAKPQAPQQCLILENGKAKFIEVKAAANTQDSKKDSAKDSPKQEVVQQDSPQPTTKEATQDSHAQEQNAAQCLNYSVLYEGYFYHWIFNTEENVSGKTQANNEDSNAEQQKN